MALALGFSWTWVLIEAWSLAFIMALFPAAFSHGPSTFLAGCRDAGRPLTILRDRVNWLGQRTVEATDPDGRPWTLETYHEGRAPHLLVVTPDGHRHTFARDLRLHARELLEDPSTRQEGLSPKTLRTIWRRTETVVAVAFVLVLLPLIVYQVLGGEPSIAAATAVRFAGVAVIGFVTVVGVSSSAYTSWTARVTRLGRRGGGAVLLAGLGAGVCVLGLLDLAMGWMLEEGSAARYGAAAALGALAAAPAFLVLAGASGAVRLLNTLGALLAAGGGALLSTVVAGAAVGALALLILFQTWTRAPVMTGDDASA